MQKKKPKVGLALGSGAAKGMAHIGVLKVLEREGIPIDMIAGTSIGSLIGGIYASGMPVDEMENIATGIDWKQLNKLLDFAFPISGFISGKKVKSFIKTLIKIEKIEQLKVPFAAVATDIETGEEVIIKTGSLIEAIRASCSMPGIFTPVRYGQRVLVDGGLVNPVPVNIVKNMGADIVIAVNVVAPPDVIRRKRSKKKHNSTQKLIGSIQKDKQNLSQSSKINISNIKNKISKLIRERLIDTEKFENIAEKLRKRQEESLPNIIAIMSQVINIAEANIVKLSLNVKREGVELIIIEPDIRDIKSHEFFRAGESILAGEEATLLNLAQIKKKVK